MDQNLRVQVLFKAIGELTAPLKRMANASKGLARDISATNRKLGELKRAESQVAAYKGVEARWKATGAQLKVAQERTAALRAEMAKVDDPTKRMAASLTKLEAAEHKATERHEEQGRKLQELGTKLDRAGVNVGELGRHEERLQHELRDSTKLLDRQRDALARVEKAKATRARVRETGGRMMTGGAVATAGVTVPLISAFIAAVPDAKQVAEADAMVAERITRMGNAAKFTLPQLRDMASKLEDLSTFDDDDIMRQVTSNMLSFGTISGERFARAQAAAVNMAAQLKEDLQPATIRIGKALNDPIKGISALRKVGVQFTDQQKEQIKHFAESGQLAKAQTIILNELAKEFGGAANAQRRASPDAEMQQQWRTMKETMGAMALTVLPTFMSEATKLMRWFNGLGDGGKKTTMTLVGIAAVIGPLLFLLGALVKVVGFVLKPLGWLFNLFRIGASGARPIMTFFRGVLSVLRFLVAPVQWIIRILGMAIGAVAAFLGLPVWVVAAIAAALVAAGILIYKYWDQIKAAFGAGWAWVKNAAGNAWGGIKGVFLAGLGWLAGLGNSFASIGAQLMRGLINGIGSMLGAVKDKIVNAGAAVVGWFKEKLGIHSPSRVFAMLGTYTMAGLAQGIDRGAPAPVARVRATAGRMIAAMASSSLATAIPAGAATLGDAPSAGRPSTGSASFGLSGRGGDHYEFHVYAAPGMDAQALADDVMKRLERAQASRNRSSYRDEDA